MTEFKESMRYDYPMSKDSIVVDIGGFIGDFSIGIYDKFCCAVDCYEPIDIFFLYASTKIGSRMIRMFNYGVGSKTETVKFYKRGDATGFIHRDCAFDIVKIVDVADIIKGPVDLVKINIEGMEYDLIDRMIGVGLMDKVRFLQVQFHNVVEDADLRSSAIRAELSKTHNLMWSFPWVWESWERK